ncbi:MAG: immunoglobulin domain-containing protein, partial [Cyclobacteriaceae bacterium]|nr:immunoglobulin domain-containing protein [Cyclobacteriaceae bacterium]
MVISELPEITTQPVSQTWCEGSDVTFSVNAGLTSNPTYQWRKDGTVIPLATTSTYTITGITTGDGAVYDVIVGGTCAPTVTSVGAGLTVTTSPVITGQPAVSQTICEGSPASFGVIATGTGLSYQWKKGGIDITGATGSSYNIPATVSSSAGVYSVDVIGSCGLPVTSSNSTLVINELPEITVQPVSQTWCEGSDVTFSVNAGLTSNPTYQWRKDGTVIPLASSSTYTITGITTGDGAVYDVIVGGTCAPTVT